MFDYTANRMHHAMPLHIDVVVVGVVVSAHGEVHR